MSQSPQPTPDYASPSKEKTKPIGDLGAPQAVFDTVGGPNLRLRDNLIQLASVVVAVVIAFIITLIISHDPAISAVVGLIGGLIGGILISGAVLGIYRGITGIKKMAKK